MLTAFLAGHIDSSNAAQAEQELNELRSQAPEAAVLLDLEKLAYISSAGLRVILRLRKERPELRIVNAAPEVYEILEMTGFTEMMPVEKAYRRLSVEGCEVIGRGAKRRGVPAGPGHHIKNVMMQNGEALLIDMDTLCMGHPVFEFASIFLAYQGFGELDHGVTERFLGISYETGAAIWDRTLRLYFATDDQARLDEIAGKAKVIGYARLLRRTIRRQSGTAEGQAIIANCKARLAELLAVIDTLVF